MATIGNVHFDTKCKLIRDSVSYADGVVRILDRRRYPFEESFVDCSTVEETAVAIEEMVTQSGGPPLVAAYAMCAAARLAESRGEDVPQALEGAATRLIRTRPTNNHLAQTVTAIREFSSLASENRTEDALLGFIERRWYEWELEWKRLGEFGAGLIPPSGRVLTYCWAEFGIIYPLEACIKDGSFPSVTCSETRPYLQGARLTAQSVMDLGLSATVVTDGMPAWLMASGEIDLVIVGADRVTADGSVVNKIGTLSVALGAKRAGVPFYACTTKPDLSARTGADVEIEERDPAEVLQVLGVRTAAPGALGRYPAFDCTPPDLVTGLITPRGVVAPGDIQSVFGAG